VSDIDELMSVLLAWIRLEIAIAVYVPSADPYATDVGS
jgi:hypothetical protein